MRYEPDTVAYRVIESIQVLAERVLTDAELDVFDSILQSTHRDGVPLHHYEAELGSMLCEQLALPLRHPDTGEWVTL